MEVVVHVKKGDPYSHRMLEFLKRKNIEFTEKEVEEDYPLLFINGEEVGDYEKVTSLDLKGELDVFF